MDVAYYLSELLGQLGEINVPGLGYFAQIRIEGYYNATNSTFYPPKNKVQFDPQIIDDDDDTLAQYIADKRNISLASSRYFTEKYISNLKKEAMMKDVPLADLGFLYMEGSNISFKPADVMKNDPTVFGYGPLQMERLEGPSFVHQMEAYGQVIKEQPPVPEAEPPKLPEPDPAYELPPPPQLTYESVIREAEVLASKPQPAPAPESEPYIPPVKPEEQEEFVFQGKTYVSPEGRSYKWLWITLAIVLGVLVVGVLGMLAIHKYKPALYDQMRGVTPAPVAIKVPLHTDSLKKDTVTKDTAKKPLAPTTDTTYKSAPAVTPPQAQNSAAPAIDSTKVRYEVIGSVAKSLEEANRTISNFGILHLAAYIVKGAPGSSYKISLGHYPTYEEAINAINELNRAGKVKGAWPLKINPKK